MPVYGTSSIMTHRIGLVLCVISLICGLPAAQNLVTQRTNNSGSQFQPLSLPGDVVSQNISLTEASAKLNEPQVIRSASGPRELPLRYTPVEAQTFEPRQNLLKFPSVKFQNIENESSPPSSPHEPGNLRSSSFLTENNSRRVQQPSRLISHLGGPFGDLPTAQELSQPKKHHGHSHASHTQSSHGHHVVMQGVSFITSQPSSSAVDDLPSPFWLDPSGRPPPPAPTITPAQLNISKLPCDLSGEVPPCDVYARYRRINASCNSLTHPRQGMAGTLLQRIFSHPSDVTMMRRFSVTGRLLPNPRVVSEATRNVQPKPRHSDINLFFVFLGQFIDHDMVFTPTARDPDDEEKGLRCTNCSSWLRHPACAPINVSPYDSYFSGGPSRPCLPFTRSVGRPVTDATGTEYVEQVNLNTAYLDLSVVYGSTDCLVRELRTFKSGMLLTTSIPGSSLGLPVIATASHFASCTSQSTLCYRAGDERSSENAGLLVVHTLFLREHNRICRDLEKINPGWEDEQLFQEARRLNIAQYQHLVFHEFLPTLLGSSPFLKRYKIKTPSTPFPHPIYKPENKAAVLQELSTAAFRFGHTLVPDTFILADEALKPMGSVALVKVFDNPSVMQESIRGTMVDALLRGLLSTRLESPDLTVVTSLRDKLFVAANDTKSGSDLVATNVARGRDHGIAPYTAYREFCDLPKVRSWQDLSPLIPPHYVKALKGVYDHWDDVDLFIGGIAEAVEDYGVIGPTFACLISLQFHLLSTGDRFWYHGGPAGLSAPELHTVYASGVLSKLVSRNIDEVKSLVPLDALRIPNIVSNPAAMAGTLLGTDLRPWMDPHALKPKDCDFKGVYYGAGDFPHVSPCLVCQCMGDGNLKCNDRPVDCRALDAYEPRARESEHCHKVCPVLP